MRRISFGITAGMAFGIIDVLVMVPMDLPNKEVAMAGAFVNRFAIGFLIPLVNLPIAGWLRGGIVGFLLSCPDAIITGAYPPILGIGVIGGIVIGHLVERTEKHRKSLSNP